MFRRSLIFFAISLFRNPAPVDLGRIHEKPISKGVRSDRRDWKNNLLAANQKAKRNSVNRGR